MKLNIRPMTRADLPEVLEIIGRTMSPEDVALAKKTFAVYFQPPSERKRRLGDFGIGEFYVAEIDGRVVGVNGFYTYNGTYWLGWFAVDPRYQRKGVGTALLKRVENEVSRRGAKELFVYTSSYPDFEQARRFYERRGFRRVDRVDHPRFSEDMIFFRKELKPA